MSLTLLVSLATMFTGMPCAGIDNGPNRAAFAVPRHGTVVRTYTDYGDNLGYSGRVPRAAWPATRAAEDSLRHGAPGHKVRIACG